MGRYELHMDNLPRSIELVEDDEGAALRYIDERFLPGELRVEQTRDWRRVVDAMKTLAVRGAPAIGLAGASALALWAAHAKADELEGLQEVADEIAHARPTAVNLSWAVERCLERVEGVPIQEIGAVLFDFAKQLEREDERANRAMGRHGEKLLNANSRVLTHCNAGSLAAGFYGTALGIVYAAAQAGKIERVYADETRPVGQGARLTAWELARVGIPVTVICDNMAASLMATGCVDAVIVGADRIAANGDAANKIGTYGLAVLAHEHGIPFYVAAPTSTIDRSIADGSSIPIEQRAASEVLAQPIDGVDVWNPAFDVTPARYITAIVTEKGVFEPDTL